MNDQGVPIGGINARVSLVVIEMTTGHSLFSGICKAQNFVIQVGYLRAAVFGVSMSQQGVHKVLCCKLATLSLEGFIGGEIQTLFNFERVRLEVGRHLRHGFRGIGHQLRRHGHPIVSQQRLKDGGRNGVGVKIVDTNWIKTSFGCGKCQAQYLVWIGGIRFGVGCRRTIGVGHHL